MKEDESLLYNIRMNRSLIDIIDKCKILLCALLLSAPTILFARSTVKAPILIISSYNPDAGFVAPFLSHFINEYKVLENDRPIIVENMNCKTLSETQRWKNFMKHTLEESSSAKVKPAMMVILGQEAWAAYLSQPTSLLSGIPVMCAKVSRNTITFPKDSTTDPSTWQLPSLDVLSVAKKYNVVGGYLNEYDVRKNMQLIKSFYPQCKKVYFLTDNSCGGLSLQVFINAEMKKQKEMEYSFLDGRKLAFNSLINELTNLPKQSALVIGTWRIDRDEVYYMQDAFYQMRDANPFLPVFSISQKAIGYWAIGGYVPTYDRSGESLASDAFDYIHHTNKYGSGGLKIIKNEYVFDEVALHKYKLDKVFLPANSRMVNPDDTFWGMHRDAIVLVGVIFFALVAAFLGVTYLLLKTRKLKNDLEKSQEGLLLSKKKAEEASKFKSAFIANMSHEIRTPLNVIVGFSDLLTSQDLSDKERNQYFDEIKQSTDWLLQVINNILDISSLESGKASFNFERRDVVALCKSILEENKVEDHLGLEYKFDSRFEIKEEPIDAYRLQQVLGNLFSNAEKFTTEGSVTLSFDVDDEKQLMYFSLTDTGCGIPEEKQITVFEHFEKLNDFVQGAGLGLSICKMVVEQLGGDIWVDPTYLGGTRIIFFVPIMDDLK